MEEFETYTEEILSENSCKIMQVGSCRIIHGFTFDIMEEFGTYTEEILWIIEDHVLKSSMIPKVKPWIILQKNSYKIFLVTKLLCY